MAILNYGITNSAVLLTQAPLSERLKTAGLNTVLGLGIVFAVLILIIIIISLLKYVAGFFNGLNKSNNGQTDNVASEPEINTATDYIVNEEADLTDDNELVAVIAAAISAFRSETNQDDFAGGFVVRSIRKINNRRM